MRKEHVPIREPSRCIEWGCAGKARTRQRCRKHYQQFRTAAIQLGIWEQIRLPCGNFGDPEGHRASATMGGAKRSEDRAGLAAAGRIGGRRFAENKEAQRQVARLGGLAVARDRERMAEMGRKGNAVRWQKRSQDTADQEGA
ncbi:MAG: hypothetical protein HY320_08360 [Armatimonadetes bacterium]|nr:hypothetical protein [Armatimonadota bacterium]